MNAADPEYLQALLGLARACLVRLPQRAMATSLEVVELATVRNDIEVRFEALCTLAAARLALSDFAGGDVATDQASEVAAQFAQRARVLSLRAIRLHRSGDIPAALVLILEALQLWERADPQALSGSATTHNVAGTLFAQLGDYAGAIEQFQIALSRVDHVVDDDVHSVVSNNLGRAHRELGEFDRAEAVLLTALTQFTADDVSFPRAGQLINLGMVQVEAGRPAEGRQHILLALQIGLTGGYPRIVGAAQHAVGLAFHREGALAEAKRHFEEAIKLRTDIGERTDLAETQVCYAQLMRDMHEDGAAETLLLAVVHGTNATAMVRPRVDALHLLYRINRDRGDLSQALDYHVAYAEQTRTLVDDNAMLRYQALQARYRHEQLMREREAERARGAAFEALAHTDPLTGIPNRRFADAHIDAAVAHAKATGRALSVCILDIDYFKRVNDRYSHEVGDAVLRAVAGLLQSQLRDGDMVARYGGEEFVLLFSGASVQQAEDACVRLLHAIRTHEWSRTSAALAITASVGVADTSCGFDRAALLSAADSALYQAKAAGRDRVARSG
jgi:diguanylate cyclase (GGDEF)-like protein